MAMTVALRSPRLLKALIPVDNAPVDANLKSDFHKYVRGLREIEEAKVKKQVEADEVLKRHEKVSKSHEEQLATGVAHSADCSRSPYDNFSSRILFDHQMGNISICAFPSKLLDQVLKRWVTFHTMIQTTTATKGQR